MPYITMESGELSDAQEEELRWRLTEASSETMNAPPEFFVITLKEVPDKYFGVDGKRSTWSKQNASSHTPEPGQVKVHRQNNALRTTVASFFGNFLP